MSFDVLGDLNWLAVIVATIAYFALGAVWYAPAVFGNVWMRAGGIEVPEQPQASLYVVPFLTCLLADARSGCWPRPRAPTRWERGSSWDW